METSTSYESELIGGPLRGRLVSLGGDGHRLLGVSVRSSKVVNGLTLYARKNEEAGFVPGTMSKEGSGLPLAPKGVPSRQLEISMRAEFQFQLYINGYQAMSGDQSRMTYCRRVPLQTGDIIAVTVKGGQQNRGGGLALRVADTDQVVLDQSAFRYTSAPSANWTTDPSFERWNNVKLIPSKMMIDSDDKDGKAWGDTSPTSEGTLYFKAIMR